MKYTIVTFTMDQLINTIMLQHHAATTDGSFASQFHYETVESDCSRSIDFFIVHKQITASELINACEQADLGVPFLYEGTLLVPDYADEGIITMIIPTSQLENTTAEEILYHSFPPPETSNILLH